MIRNSCTISSVQRPLFRLHCITLLQPSNCNGIDMYWCTNNANMMDWWLGHILKDRTGDQRGVNGSLKFDLKNRREKSRLHPTHLRRRVLVPHSSERLSALEYSWHTIGSSIEKSSNKISQVQPRKWRSEQSVQKAKISQKLEQRG